MPAWSASERTDYKEGAFATVACASPPASTQTMGRSQRQDIDVFLFQIDSDEHSRRQSTYHPSLCFIVHAPCLLRPRTVRLPDDSGVPDITSLENTSMLQHS